MSNNQPTLAGFALHERADVASRPVLRELVPDEIEAVNGGLVPLLIGAAIVILICATEVR